MLSHSRQNDFLYFSYFLAFIIQEIFYVFKMEVFCQEWIYPYDTTHSNNKELNIPTTRQILQP